MSPALASSASWRLFASGFRSQSTYRMALFAGLVTNSVFGLLKAAILLNTVRSGGGVIGAYDTARMGSYVWLSQLMLGAVNLYGGTELATRIKSGDVVVQLLRPIGLQRSELLREIGARTFTLIPRGLPMIVLGLLTTGLAAPRGLTCWALTPISFFLAVATSAACVYLLACTGFWLVETRGVQLFYSVAAGFLAGLFVPISLFPHWLRVVASCTPFPSMLMHFTAIAGGVADTTQAVRLVGVQLAWCAALVALGALVTARGRRRLEVQGG